MKQTMRDILELILIPILSFGVYVLWDLNKGVGLLNVQVASIIAESNGRAALYDEKLKALDQRVKLLEDKR